MHVKKECQVTMKKSVLKSIAFGLLTLAATSAFAAKPKITTEVGSVDKHGNLNLTLSANVFYAKGFGISDIVSVSVGKISFDAPVVRNYVDVDDGAYLVRINQNEVSVAINLGNLAQKSKAEPGSAVTIKMKEQRGYLIGYQKRILNTSDKREDFSSDEVFANFREVKLGSIASGKLYRSASPVNGLPRAEYAARLIADKKPALIINLDNDASIAPSVTDPFYASKIASGDVAFLNLGAALSDPVVAKQLYDGFKTMLAHDGPYVIHGKEGKLRTGFACAILSALCGATMDEINADFMLSYENYNGIKKNTPQWDGIVQILPTSFSKINGGKKITDAKLHSLAEHYLTKNVGLTKHEVEELKAKLQ